MTTSPNPPIFVWYNAFNPQQDSSQHNIHLEKASVLFNLGALSTHITLSCDLSAVQGYRLAMDALYDASYWFSILWKLEAENASATIDLLLCVVGKLMIWYCEAQSLLQEGCQTPCLDLLSEVGPVMIKDGNLVINLRGNMGRIGGDELPGDHTEKAHYAGRDPITALKKYLWNWSGWKARFSKNRNNVLLDRLKRNGRVRKLQIQFRFSSIYSFLILPWFAIAMSNGNQRLLNPNPNPERVLKIPVKKTDPVELYRPLRNLAATRYSESDAQKV
ncbi:hypothetical protein Ahy_B02g057660 isoform D [Arachis hypogaea]|uniref:BRO1 domain-containing protein n=1 Tax=Arachis hypogaea TaxID=3818 RepID=A0A445ACH1_ARAHY|nr:hypothetical protein Ahy_B02g057660 isoform D [Arachis hypogaea]